MSFSKVAHNALVAALGALAFSAPTTALAQPFPGSPGSSGPTPGAPMSPGAPGANPGAGPNNPQPNAGPGATQKRLEQSEKDDSGRGLEWAWIQLEGGGHYTALQGLGGSQLMVGDAKQAGGGGLAGGAIGARLLFLTVGVRGRYAWASDHRQWSIAPEIGLHIPLGNLEPHVFVGAGYTALSGLDTSHIESGPSLVTRGFVGRIGGGLRYYLSRHFSIGAMITGDLTIMSRPGVFYRDDGAVGATPSAARVDASKVGSGTGIAVIGTGAIGIHF